MMWLVFRRSAPGLGALLCWSLALGAEETPRAPRKEVFDTDNVVDWVLTSAGSLLYPSQIGDPGWPGRDDGFLKGKHGYNGPHNWGWPEMIPYPDAVEHVRTYKQRYMPVYPLYNARTLVRRFRATEIPGIDKDRIIEYAEPVYYVPKYLAPAPADGRPSDVYKTDKCNRPVPAVRFDAAHKPLELALGTLEPGAYVLRVIGATDDDRVQIATRRLVIGFEVNDELGGGRTTYKKRCGVLSQFYSMAEFFFMAPEKRDYQAKVWVDPSSRLPLYLDTIDLHDRFAEIANRAAKRMVMLYDQKERERKWAAQGGAKTDTRAKPARFEADRSIWAGLPPKNIQGLDGHASMQGHIHGAIYRLPPDAKDDGFGIDLYGSDMIWNVPEEEYLRDVKRRPRVNFLRRAVYAGQKWNWQRQTYYEKAYENSKIIRAIMRAGMDKRGAGGIAGRVRAYEETGDEVAAREATLLLARIAWMTIFNVYGNRQMIAPIDTIPEYGVANQGDIAFRRRKPLGFAVYGHAFEKHADQYDKLFPYLRGNRELAESMGRFIPWIKTPEDLARFLEVGLLQLPAHETMLYQRYDNYSTGKFMTHYINAQHDEDVVKSWIHWLFRYVFTYPQLPTGVDESLFGSWNRDGTTIVGSTYYCIGTTDVISSILRNMRPFVEGAHGAIVERLKLPEVYSRVGWEAKFRADTQVAGGYRFWCGDVSGPSRPRWVISGGEKAADKIDAHNRSRALANWFGILETNTEEENFRRRRAAGLRVGTGIGHSHNDPLDLQIWARGVPLCGDWGGRPGYCYPASGAFEAHNTVLAPSLVDSSVFTQQRYVSSFADTDGARYLAGGVRCDGFYGRQVALIDEDEQADSYIVDVFRVKGGASMPAYAFHGPPPDEFETNIDEVKRGWPEGMEEPLFDLETNWHGEISDRFTATWRMSRDDTEIELKPRPDARQDVLRWKHTTVYEKDGKLLFPVWGAERRAMAADFLEPDPRKYISMHLLGRGGATAYGRRGFGFTRDLRFYNDMLFVYPEKWKGAEARWSGEAVFPVVFEPYAGEPWIRRTRLLSEKTMLGKAHAPVAIEITLRNGRKDLVYVATEASPAFELPDGGSVNAEYAFLSYDDRGLRQAVLAGGTLLKTADLEISSPFAAYEGTITHADPRSKTLTLSMPLPPEAKGDVIMTGPTTRPTSCMVRSVDGDCVVLYKDFAQNMSRIKGFIEDGMPYTHNKFYLPPEVAISNDRRDTWWLSGEPYDLEPHEKPWPDGGDAHPIEVPPRGTAIRLTNGPEPESVLREGERFWAYEVGKGNPYRYPARINLRRQADGSFLVEANADATVQVAGKEIALTRGKTGGGLAETASEIRELVDRWIKSGPPGKPAN